MRNHNNSNNHSSVVWQLDISTKPNVCVGPIVAGCQSKKDIRQHNNVHRTSGHRRPSLILKGFL